MNFLKKNLIALVAAAAVVLALVLFWPRRKKVTDALVEAQTSKGGLLNRLVGGETIAKGQIKGITLPPHPGTPELLRIDLFPEFKLNDGELFAWSSHVMSKDFGEKILKRGVTHIAVPAAQGVGLLLEKSQRMAVLYANAFNNIPFRTENLPQLKAAVDAALSGQYGGAVDMISFDPENDEPDNTSYKQTVRELVIYAKNRYGVRMVDFLGLNIANTDYNVTNQPAGATPYTSYLQDVIDFDDVIPYFSPSMVTNGDWFYSPIHTTRLFRVMQPTKPLLSYFWHQNNAKTYYLTPFMMEATAINAWMAGGGFLLNWEDGSKGYFFSADEGLFNAYYRLSQVNPYRRGKVEFIIPEISLDGGASWQFNGIPAAKKSKAPAVCLTKNATGYLVSAGGPFVGGPQEIRVRGGGYEGAALLKPNELYFEAIPA